MLSTVRRTLLDRELVARGDRVLVAISGGPDSAGLLVALSKLAPELYLDLVAASVDHGLRPESSADVEIARAQAASLKIPFRAIRLELSSGPDLRARARDARYAALREQRLLDGARCVAVGHTRDDQAETVLARILRGAGLRGLAGIAPRREDGVIRPLLDCPRAEVHALVQAAGLPVAADATNTNRRFQRSRVRHQVLPLLTEEDPEVAAHLSDLAEDARAVIELLEPQVDALWQAARAEDGSLSLERCAAAPTALRRLLLMRWAAEVTGTPASRANVEALELCLRGRGEVRLPGDLLAVVKDGRLVAHPRG